MLETGKVINQEKKLAIVLFNLGGPDKLSSVRPFLYNLFSDKWIIRAPNIIRKLIAFFISATRNRLAKSNYSLMGGKSPLLHETTKQKEALENELENMGMGNFKVFISMRYWHPFSKEAVSQIKEFGAESIIYLPLYPHCSSSTTLSSFEDFDKELAKTYPVQDIKKIGCYFDDNDFISSHIELIEEKLKLFENTKKLRILFSAHSIPKKFVTQGDPYEWQINKTYKSIAESPKISKYETILCYQSKVGPIEWLSPSTEHVVEESAKLGYDILVIPIAFVSEHIETLVELDIEYKQIATKYDVCYERVDALGVNKKFIKSLAKYISQANFSDKKVLGLGSDLCPREFKNCLCRV
ncbi:MAG: ferrochelatase [Rickettsiaceae bacterium]|nr:ferrochelatase [Rickettsiaceae bacterium]